MQTELDQLTQGLTARLRVLAERYAKPLPEMEREVEELTARVRGHLQQSKAPSPPSLPDFLAFLPFLLHNLF